MLRFRENSKGAAAEGLEYAEWSCATDSAKEPPTVVAVIVQVITGRD